MRYGDEELAGLFVGAPEPVRGLLCAGRAAKPGRTDPGRAPDIGGRWPGFNLSPPLPLSPGLIGLAGGLGPAPELNGLLPALGGRAKHLVMLVLLVLLKWIIANSLRSSRWCYWARSWCGWCASSIICCNSGGKSSTFTVCLGAAFFSRSFFCLWRYFSRN